MNCPGCGIPTQKLVSRKGTGTAMVSETVPEWCTPCLNARIRAARPINCFCDDPEHEHVREK